MNSLFNNKFKKPSKKTLIILTIAVSLTLVLVIINANITKVSAQIVPVTVSTNHLSFGTVFPGEGLQGDFIVTYIENEGDGIAYKLIQKRKPLPPEHLEYPDGGDPEMPGFYRNLCPFLTKTSLEGEGDTEDSAFVGPISTDPSDSWIIYFEVPAIFGHVSQDHTGGVVSTNGEYGCDIVIDITEQFLIDTVQVYANDLNSTSSTIPLELGVQYELEAMGTANAGGNIYFDAEYSTRSGWTTWEDGVLGYEYLGVNLLDLKVDNNFVDWGAYNPGHTYYWTVTGTGIPVELLIYDTHPSNNAGFITVNIYILP